MQVRVQLLAFGNPGEVRLVDVPDDETNVDVEHQLDRVFYWGQNDFQSMPHPSVSMGDVIEMGEDRWLIQAAGFHKLTVDEFARYLTMERTDRLFAEFKTPA